MLRDVSEKKFMKRMSTVLCLAVALVGCATLRNGPHETKYIPTRGSLSDLYVKLDGEWIRCAENIGGFRLAQSPDGRYLVITDLRGCYQVNIKAYDTQTRQLFDITQAIHSRLPCLSERPLFIGYDFVTDKVMEFGMDFLAHTQEEKPVVESLKKAKFQVDIDELMTGLTNR